MPKEKELYDLVAGDKDPSSNKEIVYVVYQTSTFLVTIDSVNNLNWTTNSEYGDDKFAPDFGEVVGSCNMAAALADRIFSGKANRVAYKKMLGEVIGRVLDDHNSVSAKKLLLIVDQRLYEHCKERVRMAYIFWAFGTVSLLGFITLAVVFYHERFFFFTGDSHRYRIIIATFLGGIGAFVTTFFRFKNYTGSVVAGLPIHRLDGFLRIFYGVVAGLLVTLALKGNVLIGFANESLASQPWLGYFLAMVGGASEILIPNLISQTEQNLRFKTQADEDAEKKKKEEEEAKKKATAAAEEKEKEKVKTTDTETAATETATEITEEETSDGEQDEEATNETVTEDTGVPVETTTDEEEHIKIEIVAKPVVDRFSPAQSKDL